MRDTQQTHLRCVSGVGGKVVFIVLLVVGVLAAGAAAQDAPPSIVDGVFTASQATRGEQRFQQSCASCHQKNELAGRRFAVKWDGLSVGDLFEMIATSMPASAPGSLKPEEYAEILAFFVRESGYPEGPHELSSDLEVLKKLRIEPLKP